MNSSSSAILERFLADIQSMKQHQSLEFGAALKKPLLLLLLVSRLENGRIRENRFDFSDLRWDLDRLIRCFGGRPARSGSRPEQPFSHLQTSPFWSVATQKTYRRGRTALISDLMDPHTFGFFEPSLFALLRDSAFARARVTDVLLNQWWPEVLHAELREQLGLENLPPTPLPERNDQFAVAVLDNYDSSCAMCGIRAAIHHSKGVDAVHVRWRSAGGPDTVENGIALCRLHHWGFDKGYLGITANRTIRVANAYLGPIEPGILLEPVADQPLAVGARTTEIAPEHLEWHQRNVWLGA